MHIAKSTANATNPTPKPPAKPIDRLQQLLPELFNPQQPTGDLYLKFQLGPQIQAAISLQRVVETLLLPTESMTPIPNMPSAVLGLMSSKGKVFWAVDLAHLLELSGERMRSRRYEMIVVQTLPANSLGSPNLGSETPLLGLSVQQIRGTLRLTADALESPVGECAPELLPYLQGRVWEEGQELMVLSVEALSHAKCLMDAEQR